MFLNAGRLAARPVPAEVTDVTTSQDEGPLSAKKPGAPSAARRNQRPVLNATPDDIAKWIAELDDDRFSVRRAATRELSFAGMNAVAPLYQVADSGSPEASVRALSALTRLYRNADDETVDAVELALSELSDSENPGIAGRAEEILERHYDVRERRTFHEIQKAGGVFRESREDKKVVAKPGGISYVYTVLHIGVDWKGGTESLKHVRRLTRLETIRFVPTKDGLTEDDMTRLTVAVPRLNVVVRGAAKLGIKGVDTDFGCQVGFVSNGSAAEKAKLLPGDVIKQFDGAEVKDFEGLVGLIKTKSPGDKVEVQISREVARPGVTQNLTLTVVLDGWK